MEIEGTHHSIFWVGHDHLADQAVLHQIDRVNREPFCPNGARVDCHDILDFQIADVGILFNQSTQVPIGKNAQQIFFDRQE